MALERLKNRPDFLAANAGRRWSTSGFVVLAHPRADRSQSPARVGFTVTKKIGGAVVRNRLKRRLREMARLVLAPVARPGVDYVMIGRIGGVDKPLAEMMADLQRGLGKLHKITP